MLSIVILREERPKDLALDFQCQILRCVQNDIIVILRERFIVILRELATEESRPFAALRVTKKRFFARIPLILLLLPLHCEGSWGYEVNLFTCSQ